MPGPTGLDGLQGQKVISWLQQCTDQSTVASYKNTSYTIHLLQCFTNYINYLRINISFNISAGRPWVSRSYWISRVDWTSGILFFPSTYTWSSKSDVFLAFSIGNTWFARCKRRYRRTGNTCNVFTIKIIHTVVTVELTNKNKMLKTV